jgi:putative endonuclease
MLGIFIVFKIGVCISQITVFKAKITTQMAFSCECYIGSCLNLMERLEEHKSKLYSKCFTSKDSSWKLFFEIPDLAYQQARNIESHIKRMKSSNYILNIVMYPEMIEKLKEKYS